MIASWARRSFAAATIFIARVILRVFLVAAMRLRIAFRDGMAVGSGLLLVGGELLGELGQGRAQRLLDVAVELAGGADGLEELLLARLDEGHHLGLVALDGVHRVVVDEAVG